ncbi:cytochrome P450 [Mrakia frigida]|uniref:cytochrome P450 n=1 Tax=Mrakia frigida TaxID=29902 RepID=UPI003FCC010D
MGNLEGVLHPETSTATLQEWYTTYGPTYKFKGFYGIHDRLITYDPDAIKFVLGRGDLFEKPWILRKMLEPIMGQGLIVVSGPRHKLQRKILQPFFSGSSLRGMWEIVVEVSNELADVWDEDVGRCDPGGEKTNEWKQIDVVVGIDRATFDIIGLTGFDHSFRSIRGDTDELYTAFKSLMGTGGFGANRQILEAVIPFVGRIFPSSAAKVQRAIRRLGTELVQSRKAALIQIQISDGDALDDRRMGGKDLVSLMVRNSLSKTLSEDQRMTDEEIFAQISTFLFAGQDTVSVTLSFFLQHLAKNPSSQTKLREELDSLPNSPTQEEVEALPFLTACLNETLRLSPGLQSTYRVATKNCTIPLKRSVTVRGGELVRDVAVKRGMLVHVPTESINTLNEVWGEDSLEFRPERWIELPEATKSNPGLYSHMMTFLDGPRSCIGFRLALSELRALVLAIIPRFEFKEDASVTIGRFNQLTTRPFVSDHDDESIEYPTSALPLLVRRVDVSGSL